MCVYALASVCVCVHDCMCLLMLRWWMGEDCECSLECFCDVHAMIQEDSSMCDWCWLVKTASMYLPCGHVIGRCGMFIWMYTYASVSCTLRTHLLSCTPQTVPAEIGCCWDWTDMIGGSCRHGFPGVIPPSAGAVQWPNWRPPCTSPLWCATSARQYSDWCYHNKLRHLPMVKHSE